MSPTSDVIRSSEQLALSQCSTRKAGNKYDILPVKMRGSPAGYLGPWGSHSVHFHRLDHGLSLRPIAKGFLSDVDYP